LFDDEKEKWVFEEQADFKGQWDNWQMQQLTEKESVNAEELCAPVLW
jgi:hypothetical protein